MPDLALLFQMLQVVLKDRTRLALENVALRQQLAVYKRTVNRPQIEDRDRIFWMSVMGMLKEWKDALVFVQPRTVVTWHRKGFRHYRRRKSKRNGAGEITPPRPYRYGEKASSHSGQVLAHRINHPLGRMHTRVAPGGNVTRARA